MGPCLPNGQFILSGRPAGLPKGRGDGGSRLKGRWRGGRRSWRSRRRRQRGVELAQEDADQRHGGVHSHRGQLVIAQQGAFGFGRVDAADADRGAPPRSSCVGAELGGGGGREGDEIGPGQRPAAFDPGGFAIGGLP